MQIGTRCPDWGCCCDHGRECCADAIDGGGNFDHLGERGGCRHIDPQIVRKYWPQYITGPRLPCGCWSCNTKPVRCGSCLFGSPAFGFLGL